MSVPSRSLRRQLVVLLGRDGSFASWILQGNCSIETTARLVDRAWQPRGAWLGRLHAGEERRPWLGQNWRVDDPTPG